MKNNAKIIFHIDLNMFFCTVAAILNPSLKGKAFAVGRENTYKGVISTASYEARAYGIHSGMSLVEAYRKKHDLIVVSVDYNHFIEYHNKFISLLKEYTNLIEVASIDEAYLDMSEIAKTRHPVDVAKEIQQRLYKQYGLSSSIGIAPTLFLAKMGSDMKKPMGLTIIRKREVEKILFPLSVKDIFGIGKKTYPKLIENNINTIGELINQSDKSISLIGENAYNYVYNAVYGNTSNVVDGNRYSDSQSISTSQTYDYPLQTEDDILFELRGMTKRLVRKLNADNYYTKTIRVTFRNTDFKTYSKGKSVDYTNDFYEIFEVVSEIIADSYHNEPLRLVGVELSGLEKNIPLEYNLFTYQSITEKENNLKTLINEFKEKYGDNFIQKGVDKK